jgi:hypothetical protein
MNNLVVARRKGVKVRFFDVERAKMGPWRTDPIAEAARADRVRLAERRQRMAAMDDDAATKRMWVAGYLSNMLDLKRAQLVEIAKNQGVKHPVKANKTQIATALAEASFAKQAAL